MRKWRNASHHGLTRCHCCGCLNEDMQTRCHRCRARVHSRIPNSVERTLALTLAAAISFIPANVLPIMTVSYFGTGSPDTILSGVILLLQHGAWPIAGVVFFASFIVPLGKIIGLFYLLYKVRGQDDEKAHGRQMRLYRVIDFFGRWSMLDVFVVALLVTLVQLGQIATIEAGPGATAFAIMVVLTMFAAGSFDPRLLWDRSIRKKSVDE